MMRNLLSGHVASLEGLVAHLLNMHKLLVGVKVVSGVLH